MRVPSPLIALAGFGWVADAEPPSIPTTPPLAIVGGSASREVVRLDPVTLAPQGRRVELGEYHGAWSFSPDRRQIAFGISASGGRQRTAIRVIDRDALTVTGEIEATAAARALGWLSSTRIAALTIPSSVSTGHPGRRGTRRRTIPGELLLADPGTGRLLARRPVAYPHTCTPASAVTNAGFAVVVSGGENRPPRLMLLDGSGRYRTTALSRLPVEVRDGACAGLAVDARRQRLFVVAAGAPIAEVALRTMRVRYHGVRLGPPSVRCTRSAKCVPVRSALWLENRRLAVSGADTILGRRPHIGAGVRLVDLDKGSARTLDARAGQARLVGATLLTYGGPTGLSGFTLAGEPRFTRRPARDVLTAAGYGYARIGSALVVLDPATGKMITRSSPPPASGAVELIEPSPCTAEHSSSVCHRGGRDDPAGRAAGPLGG